MAKSITLASLDPYLQDRIKSSVSSPMSQTERVRVVNQVIQFLQAQANWDPTKRYATFDYLTDESDYSIVNDVGLSDFKDVETIRDPLAIYERFEGIKEKPFDEFLRENRVFNCYTVEERDNADILRVIYRRGNTRLQLAALDSLTESGTWASDTSTSDATTLSADTTRFYKGSGSLKFNIDVSQSANNKASIKNTTLTAVDLTDYENVGYFRAWLDLLQLTSTQLGYISSLELRIGNDTSNYFAMTTTSALNGVSLKAGWNHIGWQWKNATETGTVDPVTIDYIELIINYSASMTDVSNARWDDLQLILPRELELGYFSENFIVKSDGTFANEFTTPLIDGNEALLLPTRHRDGFVHLCAEYAFRQMKHSGDQEYVYHQLKGIKAFKDMFHDLGHEILKEIATVTPKGNSSGRNSQKMW